MSIVPTFYQVIMPQGKAFCIKSCKRLQSSEPCSSLHLWVKGSIALGEGYLKSWKTEPVLDLNLVRA